MSETPNYYAIISANVRYDKNLTNSQKIMFGEITALSQKTGFCFASNNYFANLYDVDPSTVSKWVKGLHKNGYIKVHYKRENNQITERKIKPLMDSKGIESDQEGIELKSRGVLNKDQEGIELKSKVIVQDNNTSNNTKNAREENVLVQIDKANTIDDLLDIWRAYRKRKNKWDNIYTRQVQESKFHRLGFSKAKKSMLNSIGEGWCKLVDPDDGENEILDTNKHRMMANENYNGVN